MRGNIKKKETDRPLGHNSNLVFMNFKVQGMWCSLSTYTIQLPDVSDLTTDDSVGRLGHFPLKDLMNKTDRINKIRKLAGK